jgi:hypothetical protein
VVALADGLCGLVEGVDGGGAADGDEGFFFQATPELSKAPFFEEFAARVALVGWHVGTWSNTYGLSSKEDGTLSDSEDGGGASGPGMF